MAEYLIQDTTLTSIADKIRSKTGSAEIMSPSAMETEIDKLANVSDDTVTADKMLAGTTAHDKSGTSITGTIETRTSSDITASGSNVTVPAGYYPAYMSKRVATATQATPSITVSTTGEITASATQTAGYVSAGTKSATKQLTVQAAQTITPGTSDQTIASGKYITGTQTIKGDANLIPENIVSGVSIFGVEGTVESTAGSTAGVNFVNNTGIDIILGASNLPSGATINVPYDTAPHGFAVVYFRGDVDVDTYRLLSTWVEHPNTSNFSTISNNEVGVTFMLDLDFDGYANCPLSIISNFMWDENQNECIPSPGDTIILSLVAK